MSRDAGDLYRLEMMLVNLGCADLMAGDLDASRPLLSDALRIAYKIDDRVAQFFVLEALMCHAARSGQMRLAAQLFGAAEAIRAGTGASVMAMIAPMLAAAQESAVAALGTSRFQAESEAGRRLSRDAALWLGSRDMAAPLMRREPRESDLPEAPAVALPLALLLESLDRLAAAPEPDAPPTEVVAREITIGMQILVLLEALSDSGRVILQAVLAGCRSRSEAAVTVLAMLELARRRQVRLEQSTLFGPILVTAVSAQS